MVTVRNKIIRESRKILINKMNYSENVQLVDVDFLSNSKKDHSNIDLHAYFPDHKELLYLSREELASFLLKKLNEIAQIPCRNGLSRNERLSISRIKYYSPSLRGNHRYHSDNQSLEKEITDCITEVWQYMHNNCYIRQAPNCASDIVLTTEGKKLAAQSDPSTYLEHNKYPWIILHSRISEVQKYFRQGEYNDAIARCFKEVEIYVKEVFNITKKDLSGAALMRQAFKENQGHSDLFAGAFSLYRNSATHEKIILHHSEAWHQIMISSLLLYEIEKLQKSKLKDSI